MNEAVEVTTIHVDEFNNKAQKAEKEVRPRFEKTTKIVALMDTPQSVQVQIVTVTWKWLWDVPL